MKKRLVDGSAASPRPKKVGVWLGGLGLLAFGLGAVASTTLAFMLRGASVATVTPFPKASGVGLLANTLGTKALGAFPREISAAYLCRPTAAEEAVSAIADTTQQLVQSGLPTLQNALNPDLVGLLNAAPWPQIHDLATIARVPIVMYHDVLPEKEVFFDVTAEELVEHFEQIKTAGLTPISLEQLVNHLRTGAPLPPKPVVLSFDDGYEGHYTTVYPLLKEYQYPAVFSIFPGKPDGEVAGRSTVTWDQIKEMAADPLVTIASHSVTHPNDLRTLDDDALRHEIFTSKTRLEEMLGIPIRYFTYPAGYYDDRVAALVEEAGYEAALTMSNDAEWFAGESDNLLAIGRFGQSRLTALLPQAWEGLGVPLRAPNTFDFGSAVRLARQVEVDDMRLTLVSGGRPATIHADSRYQVPEILARSNAIAGVDGGFFSLRYLDSNVMIGPVLSQATQTFVPGNASENPKLAGRPLVLIGPTGVDFVEFNPSLHNTLAGFQAEMPNVTDGFVGSAWLVKDGRARTPDTFEGVFDFDVPRHRAFWGINTAGQPVLGISKDRVDSVELGEALQKTGLREAVMLDSGASTSLAYEGELLVEYVPRPVPHLVVVLPPDQAEGTCPLVFQDEPFVRADLDTPDRVQLQ